MNMTAYKYALELLTHNSTSANFGMSDSDVEEICKKVGLSGCIGNGGAVNATAEELEKFKNRKKFMNVGQLNIEQLDQPYYAIIQLKHQLLGVLHAVILRPDKVKKIKREYSVGLAELRHIEWRDDAIILLGDSAGDQATGWQHPENIYVVAILGKSVETDGKWECVPLE